VICPTLGLYCQCVTIAHNVSVSRFESLLVHSVPTSQIK